MSLHVLIILAVITLLSASPDPGVHFSVHSSPIIHGLQPPLIHPVHSIHTPVHSVPIVHTPIHTVPIVHRPIHTVPIIHRPVHTVPIVHRPYVPLVHTPVHSVPIVHPIVKYKVKSHYHVYR